MRCAADLVEAQGAKSAQHGDHPPFGDRNAEFLFIMDGEGRLTRLVVTDSGRQEGFEAEIGRSVFK